MSTSPAQDLFTMTLRRGLAVEREGKTIFYKAVRFREVDVADERWAVRAAERLVLWQGSPRLVISEPDHKLALTARHIAYFECAGIGRIELDMLDLDMMGKLKPYDLADIERRVFLIELAERVVLGEITQQEFDDYVQGTMPQASSPQPVGPAAIAGADAAAGSSGPELLAEYSGQSAGVQADVLAR